MLEFDEQLVDPRRPEEAAAEGARSSRGEERAGAGVVQPEAAEVLQGLRVSFASRPS
jgi:hypothetical protein